MPFSMNDSRFIKRTKMPEPRVKLFVHFLRIKWISPESPAFSHQAYYRLYEDH